MDPSGHQEYKIDWGYDTATGQPLPPPQSAFGPTGYYGGQYGYEISYSPETTEYCIPLPVGYVPPSYKQEVPIIFPTNFNSYQTYQYIRIMKLVKKANPGGKWVDYADHYSWGDFANDALGVFESGFGTALVVEAVVEEGVAFFSTLYVFGVGAVIVAPKNVPQARKGLVILNNGLKRLGLPCLPDFWPQGLQIPGL
jgi:hypothetical protein